MKLPKVLKTRATKIALLLGVISLIGCNALKKVGENEVLLTKTTIYADGDKVGGEEIEGLLLQKPNASILGYPLKLQLYNLAKDNPDSLFQNWLNKKKGREKRLRNLLSQKQVNRLGESFLVSGYNTFLKRVGEPPSIIDTAKSRKSTENLEAYYGTKGYFNSKADYTITATKKKRRAVLEYNVDLGPAYSIDTIVENILAKPLDSLYQKNKNKAIVKSGDQFDLGKFTRERQRLGKLFRNSGVYNFQESSIRFTIERDTTLAVKDPKMNVLLNISNPATRNDTIPSKPYQISRFKKINIYADYGFSDNITQLQSIDYNNYTIYFKDKLKYKPKALTDAVFFKQDSIYRDIDYVRTNRQITNLNTFRYPSIKFDEDYDNASLVANIFLAPRPKYSLDTSVEISRSDIQLVGTAFSASIISRNVFGGAETLSFSARGSIGLLADAPTEDDFTSEVGGDINLTFPRIWFPMNTEKLIPYYMLPQTRLSVGTNFQNNLGLDRQSLNSVLTYTWTPTDFTKNSIELLNIEFVRNTDVNDFFRVYNNTYNRLDDIADRFDGFNDPLDVLDNSTNFPELADAFEVLPNDPNPRLLIPDNGENSVDGTGTFIDAVLSGAVPTDNDTIRLVRRIREQQRRLTQNNLIFASNFTFQKNNRQGINDNDFFQYRFKLESAGNLLNLVSRVIPFETDGETGQRLVYGVPFSQYVKSEFDYIRHWGLKNDQVVAFRGFIGMAVPYGNANSIPFVRSYFAGGSNDNRAWTVYSLGPGRTQNLNDFNEANFKIGLNLEYRFPIAGNIKGALFADGGNIWNVFDNVDNEDATFNGLASLGDLALGTGFGLRYDFTYFIIRLDTGFKTYNPALEGSDRWFSNYFNNPVFNIGINYPF
ncbi:Surface antigen [Croceitalea dokdonensis DOKDO 023]|uniref:Surface antigen n=1 Tax=Croceitalea dokdonensis DOKDO 023 TaxID=1300341 RepID=A0A0P7AR98_9FLAO|nr:BamA/TamA family outer membrane protein [Croceitalea dokdonensis]KPM30325.1 Surface antigen [Croceitalea dokdonensis DOKDO 023]